jgi:hypothetical protein
MGGGESSANHYYRGGRWARPRCAVVAITSDVQLFAFLRVDEFLTPIPPFYCTLPARPAHVVCLLHLFLLLRADRPSVTFLDCQ